jgi:hypothetical protein
MGRLFALVLSIWAMVSIAAWAQDGQLAAEGRGLLPAPPTIQGLPPPRPFISDPAGGFSRTMFETDEDPNFKLVIRDFSFPPDRQAYTVTLPSAALLHMLSELGDISVANQRLALTGGARVAVPAGVPIAVVNNGEHAVVMRALIVEAK